MIRLKLSCVEICWVTYNYTYVSDVISKKKTKECINQALPAIVWRKGSGHSSMNIC